MELIDLVSSVIIVLSQTILRRWLTLLLGSEKVILLVLVFFISFFLLTLVFVLRWVSLHWKILIKLLSEFPLTFHEIHNRMPHFITACDYSRADRHGLRDHLRDVPWEDIFKLSPSAASKFWWVGSGWNWRIYSSAYVLGQASLIAMVFSCFCYCHSS